MARQRETARIQYDGTNFEQVEQFLDEDADCYLLERNGKQITQEVNTVRAGDWIVRVMEEEEQ